VDVAQAAVQVERKEREKTKCVGVGVDTLSDCVCVYGVARPTVGSVLCCVAY